VYEILLLCCQNNYDYVGNYDAVVIGHGPAFGCVLMKDFLHALPTRLKKNTAAYENYCRIYVPPGEPHPSEPGEPLSHILFKHIHLPKIKIQNYHRYSTVAKCSEISFICKLNVQK